MKKEYRCNALSTWFAREAIRVSEKEPQNEKRHVCRWNQSCGGDKQLTRYVPLRDDQQECIFRRVSQPVYASRDILEKRQTPLLSFPKDRGGLFKLPARFCRCELESEITIYQDLSGQIDRPYSFCLFSIFSKCLEFTVLSRKERTKKYGSTSCFLHVLFYVPPLHFFSSPIFHNFFFIFYCLLLLFFFVFFCFFLLFNYFFVYFFFFFYYSLTAR